MAVTSATPHSPMLPIWRSGVVEYRQTFVAACDSIDTTAVDVINYCALTIPRPAGAILKTITPERTANRAIWNATLEWSMLDTAGGGANPSRDRSIHPLDRPAEKSFDCEIIEEFFAADESVSQLRPINPLGEPLNPLPSRDKAMTAWTYSYNIGADVFNENAFSATVRSTNADSVTIGGWTYGANILRLRKWAAQDVYEQWLNSTTATVRGVAPGHTSTIHFYRVTLSILEDPADYHKIKRDCYGKRDTSDPRTHIPAMVDWPLAANGDFKANRTDTPYQRVLQPYPSMSWAALLIS